MSREERHEMFLEQLGMLCRAYGVIIGQELTGFHDPESEIKIEDQHYSPDAKVKFSLYTGYRNTYISNIRA